MKEMTKEEAENPTIESLLGGRSQLDEEERLRYEVTESHNFYIPSQQNHEFVVEHLHDRDQMVGDSIWALDSLLIDEEMLYAEAEEADRIY
mmetsp:Transcript_15410/g.10794  ORF Transcript_15410/g.10794 Transcript_15410/m.10794 type:complete len:91 (+) Transcript_15410:92-364(+)